MIDPRLEEKREDAPVPDTPLPIHIPWYRNGLLWAVFFIILVVIGIVLYLSIKPISTKPTVDYGKFHFERVGGMWITDIKIGTKDYTVPFRFNPTQLDNITITGKLTERFNRKIVYITFNPTTGNFTYAALAAAELSINMVQALSVKPVAACMINVTEACDTRPIVNCGDVNKSVIVISEGGEGSIELKEECIILHGTQADLVKSVDRLLYQWYGVMGQNLE